MVFWGTPLLSWDPCSVVPCIPSLRRRVRRRHSPQSAAYQKRCALCSCAMLMYICIYLYCIDNIYIYIYTHIYTYTDICTLDNCICIVLLHTFTCLDMSENICKRRKHVRRIDTGRHSDLFILCVY